MQIYSQKLLMTEFTLTLHQKIQQGLLNQMATKPFSYLYIPIQVNTAVCPKAADGGASL
jgi:hypothetical protein